MVLDRACRVRSVQRASDGEDEFNNNAEEVNNKYNSNKSTKQLQQGKKTIDTKTNTNINSTC